MHTPTKFAKHLLWSAAMLAIPLLHSEAQSNTPAGIGPKIFFESLDYDFGKVDSGSPVKHDFFFTNTGDNTLEITSVKTSCGCTTATDAERKIEPGKTGKIPVQFNSSGFGGQVHKSVFVGCNDPAQPAITLNLKGIVWKAFEISPSYAVFNYKPEGQTNQTQAIRIVNNEEQAMKISNPACSHPAFQTELSTVREGKEYELRVTAIASNASGTVSAAVTMNTSSLKMPTLSLTAFIMMQPLLSVNPGQITLASGPLEKETIFTITILNNGTNPVVLSDPTVSASGIKTELVERLPGREFGLTLRFPAGFESQAIVQATVKSSNPKNPFISIPIYQPVVAKPNPPAQGSQSTGTHGS